MKAHILNTTPCNVPNSIYFSTCTHKKKESLIPKVTFALCSTQEIHAANTFLSQEIEKVICYNNISYICAGYSSVSSHSRAMLYISLYCHATKYAKDMQNRINLIVTTALLMLFKFLLQQFLGDQQVLETYKIEWNHFLFALDNHRKTWRQDFLG